MMSIKKINRHYPYFVDMSENSNKKDPMIKYAFIPCLKGDHLVEHKEDAETSTRQMSKKEIRAADAKDDKDPSDQLCDCIRCERDRKNARDQ